MDTASCATPKAAPLRRLTGAAQLAAWRALWDLLLLPEPADAAERTPNASGVAPTSGERTGERARAGGGGTA